MAGQALAERPEVDAVLHRPHAREVQPVGDGAEGVAVGADAEQEVDHPLGARHLAEDRERLLARRARGRRSRVADEGIDEAREQRVVDGLSAPRRACRAGVRECEQDLPGVSHVRGFRRAAGEYFATLRTDQT